MQEIIIEWTFIHMFSIVDWDVDGWKSAGSFEEWV